VLVKFHSHGSGKGSGPIDYLIGKNKDREKATVLRGDPDLQKELIDSVPFVQKYTSGVLSFEEPNITEAQKNEVIDSFERAMFPGLEKDQYSMLWVEHLDKGRLELNFVSAEIELQTGKRLQSYYHAVDGKRINAWKNVINAHFGFSDPSDPSKKRGLAPPKINASKSAKEAQAEVGQYIEALAGDGLLKNRQDVLTALEEAGLKVTRETPKSISIENPSGSRNIRLKGSIYERNFNADAESPAEKTKRSESYRSSTKKRLSGNAERYQNYTRRKSEYNRERYKRPPAEFIKIDTQAINDLINQRQRSIDNRGHSTELLQQSQARPSERSSTELQGASEDRDIKSQLHELNLDMLEQHKQMNKSGMSQSMRNEIIHSYGTKAETISKSPCLTCHNAFFSKVIAHQRVEEGGYKYAFNYKCLVNYEAGSQLAMECSQAVSS